MRGFQLWINLPAREKMKPAAYRDIPAEEIPLVDLPGGGQAKVIAGRLHVGDATVAGPVDGLSTEPLYADVDLPAGAAFGQPLAAGLNALLYVFEGSLQLAGGDFPLEAHRAGVLSDGDALELVAGEQGARFLLLAGRPLGEPVVQYGPFVMNTVEEVEQAVRDYQSGRLVEA